MTPRPGQTIEERIHEEHDPGDEHRERGYKLHRISPARNESFGRGESDASQLGVVVRCGDFVPNLPPERRAEVMTFLSTLNNQRSVLG